LIGEGKQVIVTGRDPERLAKALAELGESKRPARPSMPPIRPPPRRFLPASAN